MFTQTLLPEALVRVTRPLPLVRELPADLETPVSVYLKLANQGPSFLLESVTGGEQVARYSFIGLDPKVAYILRHGQLQRFGPDGVANLPMPEGDPLAALRLELAAAGTPLGPAPGSASRGTLPPFAGGLVGYLSYESVRYFEPSALAQVAARQASEGRDDLPEAIFMLADTVVAFDHAYGRLVLIANVDISGDPADAEAAAAARLDDLQRRLACPLPPEPAQDAGASAGELQSNISQADFMAAVERAKDHIAAGDVFQVVLSQRFSRRTSTAPFAIYRALRRLNPSPYMFFFDFAGLNTGEPLRLIGASPETHVRLEGRRAILRPIAGTRPRAADAGADAEMERELLADPKERAEHVMLVDLARNDLGRVCEYGSVAVNEFMAVERYSHVMHIVSRVEGNLRPGLDAFDLLRATFPAGTVSGAPKIRAMQIIHDLEPASRGPYAGAIGYISYDGSMDTCIAIRTLVMHGDAVSVQAGAGIVADSDPACEYRESLNKARALAVAVEQSAVRLPGKSAGALQ